MRHGPHQTAQKSTRTGTSDCSTSLSKSAVVIATALLMSTLRYWSMAASLRDRPSIARNNIRPLGSRGCTGALLYRFPRVLSDCSTGGIDREDRDFRRTAEADTRADHAHAPGGVHRMMGSALKPLRVLP